MTPEERMKAAIDFIETEAELLVADGPVYAESGYRYSDVEKAIKIAAGLETYTKK